MGKKLVLGEAADSGSGVVVKPKTLEERLIVLERKVDLIAKAFQTVKDHVEGKRKEPHYNEDLGDVNKDGIPLETNLMGTTRGVSYVLIVREDGYYVGIRPYPSLSAAALGVSGSRRSGWTFWKVPDGRTAKEAFGKK